MIDWLSRAGLSGCSVRGYVNAAFALFRFGVRSGAIEMNPVRLLEHGDRPPGRRLTEPRYLSPAEVRRLLDKLSPELRPLGAVLAFAGLRVSEACRLTWAEVDLNDATLACRARGASTA